MREVHIEMPMFLELQTPNGFLLQDKACHALWYYFSIAVSNFKDESEKTMRYEGDKTIFNYYQLYKSVATIYGIDPNIMQNFWPSIDLQARKMGLTLLPKEARYRSPGNLHATIRPN